MTNDESGVPRDSAPGDGASTMATRVMSRHELRPDHELPGFVSYVNRLASFGETMPS